MPYAAGRPKKKKERNQEGVPAVAHWEGRRLRSIRTQVQSPAPSTGLRIWHCCSCGYSQKCGLCTMAPIKSQRQFWGRERTALLLCQEKENTKLCPDLRGDSKGFSSFGSKRQAYWSRCLYYSSSIGHFRVIKAGGSGSSDGFWLSSGLSFLDFLSGMKMAYRVN